jgi:3',5'-cyclic AMP phosphodiesterase CpdA
MDPVLDAANQAARALDTCAGFTFAQLCDPQLGMGGYAHDVAALKSAVHELNRLAPDFVLICGDLTHEAGNDDALAHFNVIRSGLRMPSYCAPGNHDVGNEPTAALLARFRDRVGPDYFRLRHKGCTFLVLNTQLWKSPLDDETEQQERWLTHTLAEAGETGGPVFVAGHIPLFTDDPGEAEHYYNLPAKRRRGLHDVFARHRVRALMTGHTHRNQTRADETVLMVTTASTSFNYDASPLGFRIWHVRSDGAVGHRYHPLPEPLASSAAQEPAAAALP